MIGYFPLKEVAARLYDEFDWGHSFVRELYFSTTHCFSIYQGDAGESQLSDANGPLNLRLIVAVCGSPTVFGVEFLCCDVKVFSLQTLYELRFDCQFHSHGITLNLGNPASNTAQCWVTSRTMQVAFLGKDYLGPLLRLGFEPLCEETAKATQIDACWRQCESCFNAWIENPNAVLSRCPDCGRLTQLRP